MSSASEGHVRRLNPQFVLEACGQLPFVFFYVKVDFGSEVDSLSLEEHDSLGDDFLNVFVKVDSHVRHAAWP